MSPPREHLDALTRLGVTGGAARRLARYLDLVGAWNGRVNLTGARSAEERVERLVAPVLPAVEVVVGPRLIDVGSGNGSPGLVLALLLPELSVTLLEPRLKRWAFLREAARELDTGARVLRSRHDAYVGPPAETVTVRALALPVEALAPLLAPRGRVLLFRAATAPAGFRAEPPARPGLGLTVLTRERFT